MMQKVGLVWGLVVLLLLGIGCKDKQYLVGYYSYEEYQEVCKWDKFVDEKYTPKEKWLDSLRSLDMDRKLSMQLFLGSYCPDSKKWVPRYYALAPELPVANVEIISVDTTKKDEKGLWKAVDLKKIPTFIIYDGDNEVGRIVEKPKGRLEKNIFHILKNM